MTSQLDLPIDRKPLKAKRGRGGGGSSGGGGTTGGGGSMLPPPIPDASLAREAERRYLNYALSVITSRALPDVRDGLKPVQRRILYAMLEDLSLRPDARYRKSAAIVGEVMGKYHPHGNEAIYDAMVRMAQPFSMRGVLVDGQGNFGSPDGDSAAAMRYTEAKLTALAMELMGELYQDTVEFRPNYDGTKEEPSVLPARYPNLLVNGSYGIAVGMATSIPPHNLGEVIDACVMLIDDDEITTKKLLKHVKGPDFPTGGELICSRRELGEIYETGQGSIKLRGEWTHEEAENRGDADQIIVTSVPFGVERRAVIEKIASVILEKKLPALVDVRDESTEQVRVVLELKRGTDPQLVMAYLFKNTPLQTNVQLNLTCLVPSDGGAAPAPERLGLRDMLSHFIAFRLDTVTRRIEHELKKVLERIHILEGFEIIFDRLDEAIRIIRKSDGKADAAQKLIGRFGLSALQSDAILELKLYRLAKLEILAIEKELGEKRAQAKKLKDLLAHETKRMAVVREELIDLKQRFAVKRATTIVAEVDEPEFTEEAFIVDEDAVVILCQSGWVKRVGRVKDVHATRMREGDGVLAAVAGSTRSSVAFFSNQGVCYVCRIDAVPAATGYGDPIQKLFKLGDGERIVAALSFDPRLKPFCSSPDGSSRATTSAVDSGEPQPPFALAVTRCGLGARFSLRAHAEPSTRAGRKFARLNEGDEVLNVMALSTQKALVVSEAAKGLAAPDWVMCASDDGHAIAVNAEEIPILSGPGKGVMVIKLDDEAHLLGAELGWRDLDAISVETGGGVERSLTLRSIEGTRAGRGHAVVRRGGFGKFVWKKAETPAIGGDGKQGELKGGGNGA